jgi:hypothetical protein
VLTAALAAGCGAVAPTASTTTATTPPPAAAPAPPVPAAVRTGATNAVGAFADALRNGDVELLCRPGGVFTPAVVTELNSGGETCEASLELSSAVTNAPTLAVTGVTAKPGLATAQVRIGGGSTVPVDVVPDGRRWLVSFSQGVDPIAALEQH